MPDDSFKEFVLDQLGALPDVRAKAMFGAHGLYSGENFFGILDEGRLFFKTDSSSQTDYTARGMGSFTYESKGNVMKMSYHEVPPGRAGATAGISGLGAQSDCHCRQFQERVQKAKLN